MRFRPRHYILFAVIAAVFIFNRLHRRQHLSALPATSTPTVVHNTPPPQSPAWTAFDYAANLRDAPADAFVPALHKLQQQVPADPNAAALQGCLVWLEFYRQGMAQTHSDPQMKDRSIHHITGCTRYHQDTTS